MLRAGFRRQIRRWNLGRVCMRFDIGLGWNTDVGRPERRSRLKLLVGIVIRIVRAVQELRCEAADSLIRIGGSLLYQGVRVGAL